MGCDRGPDRLGHCRGRHARRHPGADAATGARTARKAAPGRRAGQADADHRGAAAKGPGNAARHRQAAGPVADRSRLRDRRSGGPRPGTPAARAGGQPQELHAQERDRSPALRIARAPPARHRAGRPGRTPAGRLRRSAGPGGLRRGEPPAQAPGAHRGGAREPAGAGTRPPLPAHRRDHRPGQGTRNRRRRRGRHQHAGRQRRRRKCAGGALCCKACSKMRCRWAPRTFTSSRRTAAS